jgi:hypothetical protein
MRKPIEDVSIGDIALVFDEFEVLVKDIGMDDRGAVFIEFDPIPVTMFGVKTWPSRVYRSLGQMIEITREAG